jgi:hypothetical protein
MNLILQKFPKGLAKKGEAVSTRYRLSYSCRGYSHSCVLLAGGHTRGSCNVLASAGNREEAMLRRSVMSRQVSLWPSRARGDPALSPISPFAASAIQQGSRLGGSASIMRVALSRALASSSSTIAVGLSSIAWFSRSTRCWFIRLAYTTASHAHDVPSPFNLGWLPFFAILLSPWLAA